MELIYTNICQHFNVLNYIDTLSQGQFCRFTPKFIKWQCRQQKWKFEQQFYGLNRFANFSASILVSQPGSSTKAKLVCLILGLYFNNLVWHADPLDQPKKTTLYLMYTQVQFIVLNSLMSLTALYIDSCILDQPKFRFLLFLLCRLVFLILSSVWLLSRLHCKS